MRHNRFWAILLVLLVLPLAGSLRAQSATPAFAAVSEGTLTLVEGGSRLAISIPPNRGLSSVVWSPDGSQLAYLLAQEDFSQRLMTVSASPGSTAVPLETGTLEAGFPVIFTPDGHILYITTGEMLTNSNTTRVRVNRIAPQPGAQAEVLGSFAYQVGCGGGSMFPPDWQYWTEAGFGGSGLVLIWTRYGLLHSTNCSGAGLALLDLNSSVDTPIGPDALATDFDPTLGFLSRAVLSPEGERIAVVRQQFSDSLPIRMLVLADLATGAITEVPTTGRPDQLAWGADGSVFYSIQESRGTLDSTLIAEQNAGFEKVMGYPASSMPLYEVGIRQVDPATGVDRLLYSTSAYAIGRMALAPDGQSLLFSQIPNGTAWVEALANGTLDIVTDDNGSAQRASVPITLYSTPLNGGAVQMLGAGLDQFMLRP